MVLFLLFFPIHMAEAKPFYTCQVHISYSVKGRLVNSCGTNLYFT